MNSDRMNPIDSVLMNSLVEVRDEFVKTFAAYDQCGLLTQSYIQKPFTIFNLLISSNLEKDQHKLVGLPLITSTVSNTQHELIETQLNIQFLLLSETQQFSGSDFSCYEIELGKYFERNHEMRENIMHLLLSLNNLYYVIDHPKQFYPFGIIRAYEILSILIKAPDAFERYPELKTLTFSELEEIMTAASAEEGVDEVADSMWKFITAHLNHCQIDSTQIAAKQVSNIITHLRDITDGSKSSDLRQTATEVFATIIEYFKESYDLELLTDFAELLLRLLRDDDVYVRNRTSEIVMDLIRGNVMETESDKGMGILLSKGLILELFNIFIFMTFPLQI